MLAWRITRVIVHIWIGLFICAVVFPWSQSGRRVRLIRAWSRQLLVLFRVEVQILNQPPDSGAEHTEHVMVVANHVSWLDIFVLNSVQPCHFVAKADIRDWPLMGYLSEKSGTIFLARGKQREVRRVYEGLVHQIQAGKRIAFFPEGTTAAQGNILPFHANLFEAAIEAKVPVQPFSLRYIDADGKLESAVDFIGDMTFVASMQAILKSGKITVELHQLPIISTTDAHRREVARAAHLSVATSLGIEVLN